MKWWDTKRQSEHRKTHKQIGAHANHFHHVQAFILYNKQSFPTPTSFLILSWTKNQDSMYFDWSVGFCLPWLECSYNCPPKHSISDKGTETQTVEGIFVLLVLDTKTSYFPLSHWIQSQSHLCLFWSCLFSNQNNTLWVVQ